MTRLTRRSVLKALAGAALVPSAGTLQLAGAPLRSGAPPLFPFDNGLTDIESVEEQAALLKELGYAGLCTRPTNASKELISALDRHEIKVMASYIVLRATPDTCPVPQEAVDHINRLKGRDTLVWLGVTGMTTDAVVLPAIEAVADVARANGLQVALYPHIGFHTHTVRSCLRLVKEVNRPDVGVSFTLCHFLAQHDHTELEATIHAAAPHLKLVQINGANRRQTGPDRWAELIQPLGKGSLDLSRVLRTLRQVGYDGSFNLQCYGIKRPARDHLKVSMEAWRRYHTG